MTSSWSALRSWPARRWLVAGMAALGFVLLVAIPTDLIDTPLFRREVPPTWWARPSLAVSSAPGWSARRPPTCEARPNRSAPQRAEAGGPGACSPSSPSGARCATSSSSSRWGPRGR
uniref:Uncharacterized protein n=1 Tax=Janibacter limosus TaxID=53458 RepID=A0AC61U2T5_9MICO|nr:hypothetical protein [Janibacter limosus]